MAKKEIKTDYILPDAAMQQLAGTEGQQFSSLQVLKDFIANPTMPTE